MTGETWKDSGGSAIYAFAWDYDAVGNRTYEDRNGEKTYYEYDAANALERTHELAGDTWSYYVYDARGNCTRIEETAGTTYFEYSSADLVTQIKYTDATMNYFYYDAQQRRYAVQDSDGLSYFVWDQNAMNLLAERDSTGATISQYTHGHTPTDGIGSMVAATQDVGGTAYYQYPIYDQRGTVYNIVDATGAITGTYKYDAWGRIIQEETSAIKNRFRYQSNWITLKDSDGKICLSPTRLYHADLGRFLQRDPIGTRGGLNLYRAYFVPGGTDPRGLNEDDRPSTESLVRDYIRMRLGWFAEDYFEEYLEKEGYYPGRIKRKEDPNTGKESDSMVVYWGSRPESYYDIYVWMGNAEPMDIVVYGPNEGPISLAKYLDLASWKSQKEKERDEEQLLHSSGLRESKNVGWVETIPYSPFDFPLPTKDPFENKIPPTSAGSWVNIWVPTKDEAQRIKAILCVMRKLGVREKIVDQLERTPVFFGEAKKRKADKWGQAFLWGVVINENIHHNPIPLARILAHEGRHYQEMNHSIFPLDILLSAEATLEELARDECLEWLLGEHFLPTRFRSREFEVAAPFEKANETTALISCFKMGDWSEEGPIEVAKEVKRTKLDYLLYRCGFPNSKKLICPDGYEVLGEPEYQLIETGQ